MVVTPTLGFSWADVVAQMGAITAIDVVSGVILFVIGISLAFMLLSRLRTLAPRR